MDLRSSWEKPIRSIADCFVILHVLLKGVALGKETVYFLVMRWLEDGQMEKEKFPDGFQPCSAAEMHAKEKEWFLYCRAKFLLPPCTLSYSKRQQRVHERKVIKK
eukprot:2608132-Ditylum_brightwellii.AAC.1